MALERSLAMNLLICAAWAVLGGEAVHFKAHEIAEFPAGYQLTVADVNADGRPDVIALSTDKNTVEWFENPGWQRHPVAQTAKNIDLAPRDLDGDGRPELALAYGFYFSNPSRGGELAWLKMSSPDQPWSIHPIANNPVTHRLRWGDFDGDGRFELVHAPVLGPGSKGARDPKPVKLCAYRAPQDLAGGKWQAWMIDQSLTVVHGISVSDLDGDGRHEILAASYEGITRFDFEGSAASGVWRKTAVSRGAAPASQAPGASRGTSEVAPGKLTTGKPFLAALEPWHGNQVVVYTGPSMAGPWERRVLDDTLREGHALAVADFDGDGQDEIVAGWRAAGGGVVLFQSKDAGKSFQRSVIGDHVPAEGVAVADLNGDGRLDLVVSAGRNNRILWFENQ
jgi:hypothetical protein